MSLALLGQSIEAHFSIADRAGLVADRTREAAAESGASEIGTDEQAFHFANGFVKGPEGDASGAPVSCGVLRGRNQQSSGGRRVTARQSGQFVFKILEAEIGSEPGFVFAEQLTNLRDVLHTGGYANDGILSGHQPSSMIACWCVFR